MNPGIMLKALASFLNVTPEEITANFEQIRATATHGVQLLETIDARLSRIEEKLGLDPLPGEPAKLERQIDG